MTVTCLVIVYFYYLLHFGEYNEKNIKFNVVITIGSQCICY